MVNSYSVIGLMSGTSMDGVDLAWVIFEEKDAKWSFSIKEAETIPYSDQWLSRLVHLPNQTAEIFGMANVFYGRYLGQLVKGFIEKHTIKADLICSHGQTVFHNPQKGYTIQIGSGAEIASVTGVPTVCDLRSTDIALGGQGAPIVPLGERELFSEYSCFINIGGISNISFHLKNSVIGYDVCMGNLMLDYFSEQMGLAYDNEGKLASSGHVIHELLTLLNTQEYNKITPPKSLDAQEVVVQSLALLDDKQYNIPDLLRTYVEHISDQLSIEINRRQADEVLITGGGAFNQFLVEKIQEKTSAKIILPAPKLIEAKEALIIAFLGLKRWLKQVNVLSSVTGAKKDSINGALYL